MTAWVARIPRSEALCLAALRLEAGLEVLSDGAELFLRGDTDPPTSVQGLPAVLYAPLADGQLVEQGRRVPTARMPEGDWAPLPAWLAVELPTAALEARRPTPVGLQLVRATTPAEPNVLLTTLAEWAEYGESGPRLRLSRLRFAVDRGGRAVVHGLPLPPLRGQRYVEAKGVAAPAGWDWQPMLDAVVVAQALGLSDGDLCLLAPAGPAERILSEQFSPAFRSAIRLTVAEWSSSSPDSVD